MDRKNTSIQEALQILKNGGIAIYPTDTAFGIGCRIDDEKAVDRLFEIRKRPRTQATPVLVASEATALAYFRSPSEIVRRLMKRYWPGALTIIYFCDTKRVYSPVRGDGESIGLRMPDHPLTLSIITGVGVPVLGPSANFHDQPTPYHYVDLDPDLMRLVDYVLPGQCHVGKVSTVVDCRVQPYRVIRQGAVALPPHQIVTNRNQPTDAP